jgi:DNA (cytosine-5)-methyltransferase 1
MSLTRRSAGRLRATANPDRRPRAIDLFSGVGGLSLGLRRAGFRVLLGIDIDPLAVACYRQNHRGVEVWERDIFGVRATEIIEAFDLSKGDLDLVAGCPPCEGFSRLRTLNRSRPVEDRRNELVEAFGRLVIGLRPKAVLMENVPGLAADPRFERLISRLERAGYRVLWKVLDAARYGVPQRRRRLILTAGLRGEIELPCPESRPTFVRQVLKGLPPAGKSGDPCHDHSERRTSKVKELMRRIPRNGGGRLDLGEGEQLPCHVRLADGFRDIYGRMAWDDVAPTITSGFVNPSKGRFLHPTRNRTITVREGAILQSFPQRYEFEMTRGKYPVAVLVANAVPPKMAEAHALAVREYLAEVTGEGH